MPTQATFLTAAAALDDVADDADRMIQPVQDALTPDVLRGGVLTDQVHRAIDDAAMVARMVAATCRSTADECRFRAQVCQQYWEDVAAWERANDRYERQINAWYNRNRAHLNDPTLPGPGPRPSGPGDRPVKLYDWID